MTAFPLLNKVTIHNKSKIMKEQYSAKFLRQRKMMTVLPLLVIPFLTLLFWALGGGQGLQGSQSKNINGLNLNLPDANFKDDKNEDKLSFYKEADDDSLQRQRLLLNDPYYKDSINTLQHELLPGSANSIDVGTSYSELQYSPYSNNVDRNEQRVYKKINELKQQINQSDINSSSHGKLSASPFRDDSNEKITGDVDKLHDMMVQMNDNPEDPEMNQLNNTLDKILDIQNPQRVQDRIKQKSLQQKEVVFVVNKTSQENNIGLLDTSGGKSPKRNGFYSIDNTINDVEDNNAIEAVVNADQTLVNSSVIKLRLTTDTYINGVLVPKDNFVFGIALLRDERLEIEINFIRNNKSIFPVKLEVYDMDGLPGIYIPGAISRDVAKHSADNSLQLMELSSMDPSIKAQAAAAGISTVKNMLSRKVKQIKVMVKAGYKVLLKNKNLQ